MCVNITMYLTNYSCIMTQNVDCAELWLHGIMTARNYDCVELWLRGIMITQNYDCRSNDLCNFDLAKFWPRNNDMQNYDWRNYDTEWLSAACSLLE